MAQGAAVCLKCGVQAGRGASFCASCGKPLVPGAVVCTTCGVSAAPAPAADAKSKMTAGLLGIFLGFVGVHNFYLGYTGKAVAVIGDSTFLHSGITGLIDIAYNGSNSTVLVLDNAITGIYSSN